MKRSWSCCRGRRLEIKGSWKMWGNMMVVSITAGRVMAMVVGMVAIVGYMMGIIAIVMRMTKMEVLMLRPGKRLKSI